MVRRALLLYYIVAAAACSFQGSAGPGFQCGEGDWCPAGQVCQSGFCVIDPLAPDAAPGDEDGAPPADAAPPDGGTPALRCGTLSLLRDDFEDGIGGNPWWVWNDSGVSAFESGGAFVVELAQGTADVWGGATSNARYDLEGGALEVEVLEIGGEYTLVEVVAHTGPAVQIFVYQGMLTASVYQGPNAGVRAETPYVAADHRYWRLRVEDGIFYWETSPDRAAWSVLHQEPSPVPVEHVTGGILAGVQVAGGITRARFGDVNLAAPAGLVYCPGTDLVDDFEDGVIDPNLTVFDETGCTVTETGGVLVFAFDDTGNDRCQVKSEHLYDLTDSEVRIDVGGAFDGPETLSWFQFEQRADTSTRLEIEIDDGFLDLGQRVDGVDTHFASLPFDPVAHRWWRIRGAAGRVYLETSPDGTSWTARLDAPAQMDLSQLRLELGAETLVATVAFTFPVAAMNTD